MQVRFGFVAAVVLTMGCGTASQVLGNGPDGGDAGARDSAPVTKPDAHKSGSEGGASCTAPLARCEGTCVATASDPDNCGACGTKCTTGEFCVAGACKTTCPLTVCAGACTDTALDPANCGSCGSSCPTGDSCAAGKCVAATSCPPPQTTCAGTCTETALDPANCGACGHACGVNEVCIAGACAARCAPFETTCGVSPNEYCAAVQTDPKNCGGCDFECAAGSYCSEGRCAATCVGVTSTLCSGMCVDTDSDNQNCGSCDTACPSGEVCSDGACATTCVAGYATCGTTPSAYCAATHIDPSNCGSCATVCPSGEVCSSGACSATCTGAANTLCNGLCANTRNDNTSCGACGHACAAGTVCSAGECAATCATGYTTCGTGPSEYCSVVSNDPLNCGACGTECGAGQVCAQGTCAMACDGLKGTSCGGACADLTNDPANCGSCGHTCAAGNVCSAGLCVAACSASQLTCTLGATTFCTDGTDDPANCGGCGTACTGGKVCSGGLCGATCQVGYDTCGTGPSTFCTHLDTDPENCGTCGDACAPPVNGAAVSCTFGACGFACNPGYAAVNNNNSCLTLTGISDGTVHSCGLTAAGGVMCWGDNSVGELGNGTLTSSTTPVTVVGLGGVVTKVVAGSYGTCAVLATTGAVQCWGLNGYGQLGNGMTTNSSSPVNTQGLSGVIDLQAGAAHYCALTKGGAVECWGENNWGQLGNSTTTYLPSSVPVVVTGLSTGITTIAVGHGDIANLGVGAGCHACAINTAGSVQCWGANQLGQLGNNTSTSSTAPGPLVGVFPPAIAITAGQLHTCMLFNNGSVDCWGSNTYGELGAGVADASAHEIPQAVPDFNGNVTAIASGGIHNCALTKTGATLCWGYNGAGQLGDGTTTNRSTPTPLVLPAGVTLTGIPTLGLSDSFAVSTTGPVYGWGYNANGQLGDGTTSNRSNLTPIR